MVAATVSVLDEVGALLKGTTLVLRATPSGGEVDWCCRDCFERKNKGG